MKALHHVIEDEWFDKKKSRFHNKSVYEGLKAGGWNFHYKVRHALFFFLSVVPRLRSNHLLTSLVHRTAQKRRDSLRGMSSSPWSAPWLLLRPRTSALSFPNISSLLLSSSLHSSSRWYVYSHLHRVCLSVDWCTLTSRLRPGSKSGPPEFGSKSPPLMRKFRGPGTLSISRIFKTGVSATPSSVLPFVRRRTKDVCAWIYLSFGSRHLLCGFLRSIFVLALTVSICRSALTGRSRSSRVQPLEEVLLDSLTRHGNDSRRVWRLELARQTVSSPMCRTNRRVSWSRVVYRASIE